MASYKNLKVFEMFEAGAGFALKAAKILEEMITSGYISEERIEAVKEVRQGSGDHMDMIRDYLEAAFITPIDRDDIYKIAKKTDDITESIYSAAGDLWMMNVTSTDLPMKTMAGYITLACEKLTGLMSEIKKYKKKNKTGEKAAEISEIKGMGDKCYKDAVRELFLNEEDPACLIKVKEIHERLKDVLNSCGSAADCVQTILITKT